MASILTIILIAISLSMDAFSLSLVYGMIDMQNKRKLALSIVVGLYHLIMPIIGIVLATFLKRHTIIDLKLLSSIILLYLGIDLLLNKTEIETKINDYFIFGLSVSLDSLVVGVSLNTITNYYLMPPVIFCIFSFTFTYLGLTLGNIIGKEVGIYSKKLGGLILLIIAITMFIR